MNSDQHFFPEEINFMQTSYFISVSSCQKVVLDLVNSAICSLFDQFVNRFFAFFICLFVILLSV